LYEIHLPFFTLGVIRDQLSLKYFYEYVNNITIYDKKYLAKNNLPFLPFLLSIFKKCQKNFCSFFSNTLKKMRALCSQPFKKNTESGSFLKNLKTDIFKNVKNQKKFF
jgi:hypothetical protein